MSDSDTDRIRCTVDVVIDVVIGDNGRGSC